MSGGPERRREVSEPWVLRELRRPVAAPDLTGPVMRRLGLGDLTPRRAARRRALRIAARLSMCVAVVGGSALLVRGWTVLSQVQPAPGPTIPAAVRHDLQHLQHHGRTIGEAIRTIQELGAVQAARGDPEAAPPGGNDPPDEAPVPPRV